jgi:hypothetical protein
VSNAAEGDERTLFPLKAALALSRLGSEPVAVKAEPTKPAAAKTVTAEGVKPVRAAKPAEVMPAAVAAPAEVAPVAAVVEPVAAPVVAPVAVPPVIVAGTPAPMAAPAEAVAEQVEPG